MSITLLDNFRTDERGNIWLTSEDGRDHTAWFKLEEADRWLEIDICVDNYPGFHVAIIKSTKEELARHIREHCAGMLIRKCNLPGFEELGAGDSIPEEADGS